MSMTAQRKDISDPAVVREFSEQVGDKLHLDYLYCLTVADICATNPTLWNTWRASLLRQLYENSKRMLQHGLENPVNRDARIADKQAGALSILMGKGAVEAQILQLWKDFSDEYFLRETAANIAWHSETILNAEAPVETLVSLREVGSAAQHEGATQVFIYSRDAEFLFANCTAALEKLNLNVLGARLFTTHSDYCMDTYTILEDGGWPVGKNPRRKDEIRSLVLDYVSRGMKEVGTVQLRRSRQEKYFVQNSRVNVSLLNPDSSPFSILEINCPDQPGLLASIGKLFIDYDINLKDARITTLGEKVEDLFYITDKGGQPIRDRELVQQLIEDAKSRLEERLGV
jgi:[protein-PII] uridylyltransferase